MISARKQIWFLEFKKCGIIIIEFFKDLRYNGLPHKFGFIINLVFTAISLYRLYFPVIKQDRMPVFSQKVFFSWFPFFHDRMHL